MKKNNNIMILAFVFLTMVTIAMSDNVRGVFIPEFKMDFDTNNTQMGTLLLISSLGYVSFTYIGGLLCERIGQKNVMIMGFLFSIFSLLELYFSISFLWVLVGMFFLSVGVSLLAIGINTLIPLLLIGFQATLMNLIHFFYGLGATITQRTAGILLFRGVSWRHIYLYIGIIFAVVLIGFIFVKIPESEKRTVHNKINHKEIFNNKVLYFYMIALGLYVAAEISTGNWFVNFMKVTYGFNEERSTFYSALFFGVFTVGRLVGGFVVEKIDHIKSVMTSLVFAFCLYTAGLVLKESGILLISISGLFFAISFPTMVITISKVFPQNSAYVTGIIITASSAASMIINFLLGWLNDLIGVYYSFYIIPICLFISIIFMYLIYTNNKKVLVK